MLQHAHSAYRHIFDRHLVHEDTAVVEHLLAKGVHENVLQIRRGDTSTHTVDDAWLPRIVTLTTDSRARAA